MKLAFFDDFKLGVVAGDKVVDVTDAVKDIPRLGPRAIRGSPRPLCRHASARSAAHVECAVSGSSGSKF